MDSYRQKLPPNPHESANILSKLFFIWTLPFFKIGYEKALNVSDVYEPLAYDRAEYLGNRLEANWNKRNKNTKSNPLLCVILRTFWKEFASMALLCFCNDILFRLAQPIFLSRLLKYYRKDTTVTYNEALFYASAIVLFGALKVILGSHFEQIAPHVGMQMRVAVNSLIYRKALRLSQTALGETSPGKMVNLLTNDVSRFDWATFFVNYLWIGPLLTIVVSCFVWIEIGFVGLIGILVIFTVVPMLSYAGKLTSIFRLQTALKTDERIRFMDEIISGVQVIKMYAWEKPFAKIIANARKMELKVIRKVSYLRGLHMTFMIFTSRMALFGTMVGIVLINGAEQITAARIFAISSLLQVTAHMMSQRFSRGIAESAEVLVALKRLEKFLNMDEREVESNCSRNGHLIQNELMTSEEKRKQTNPATKSVRTDATVCISMQNVQARWATPKNSAYDETPDNENDELSTKHQLTLNGVSIDFPRGQLIGVIGPVGCGKSSMLQAILRELPLECGSIDIDGTISYASQEPWVFAASIRQNILFGQEYDHDRYDAVVKCCALQRDFEQFENGDLTIIGERGASVSGGQRARINLARACYREADIYLLDDPLSAVDAHVGNHIFDKCIGPRGRLARHRSTRILVTHQVHFLKEADWIIVLKDAKVEIQGKPADLYTSDVDFVELVGIEKPNEENLDKFSRQNSEALSSRSSSSNTLGCLENRETVDENENRQTDEGVQLEASSKGKVKGSLFLNYFRAGAHWPALITVLFSFLFVQFLGSAVDYWVSIWIKQEEVRSSPQQERPSFSLSTEWCIYIQTLLVVGLLVFGIARSVGFYSTCIRISRNIHNAMFMGIISTTMRFFDTNPSGRILNRFAKDLGSVDEVLPKSILDSVQNILSLVGVIVVIAVANPYFLIPVSVLSVLSFFMRNIYIKTSKDIKRLEGITKSPAFTHLSATLNGLSTIRAYNTQAILQREYDNLQDTHSACWYMSITLVATFSLFLDALCAIYIACVVFYYIFLDTEASVEKIGLAISQALTLTGMVPFGVRQSAEIANHLVAVERLLEYRDLEPEKLPKNPISLAKDWPTEGRIEFRNVFYRYFAEAEPVLCGLSFVIKPMEKIGVVGRTGAGKSSLIGALFRLARIEGEILIDNVDTATIGLEDLRKRIAIIPQDPVLFSGTLRRNLDPFEEYSDAEVWSALESVELKNTVSDAFGLQSVVLPRGVNYSVGQRQLLCLARAILRKNRILVLDEATANVDPQTDTLIQQTIRTKFIDCTVITVAHRLHTIIDSDRVIVMDSGKIVEFDEAHNLLQHESGIFYGMVKILGEHELDRLTQIAAENAKK